MCLNKDNLLVIPTHSTIQVLWEIKPLAVMWNFLAVLSLGYYIYKIVNVSKYVVNSTLDAREVTCL